MLRGIAPALLALCWLALRGIPDASAMWAELSDAELVERSPLIVAGTIVGTTRLGLPAGAGALTVGVIRVDAVYKGSPDGEVVLIALPTPRPGVWSSGEITYRPGQDGLWFLRPRGQGTAGLYLADHPQRFVERARMDATLERLRPLLPGAR